MITEKFKITIDDINGELTDLHQKYLATRRVLLSQIRHLTDIAAGQGFLVQPGALADGATLDSTKATLRELDEVNNRHRRHLNALLRVIQDEIAEKANAAQSSLLHDEDGNDDGIG